MSSDREFHLLELLRIANQRIEELEAEKRGIAPREIASSDAEMLQELSLAG